ncbi:MAG: hypothetical protein MO852_02095 [Candidatus Devosia euplotis]|nr:hypothetical protein [Candidatus Devosia euplotis]
MTSSPSALQHNISAYIGSIRSKRKDGKRLPFSRTPPRRQWEDKDEIEPQNTSGCPGNGGAGCFAPDGIARDLPRNIRTVIGSTSAGGDTYQNSAIVAQALSDHIGVNIKVDPVGASEGLKALERDARGHHDHVAPWSDLSVLPLWRTG